MSGVIKQWRQNSGYGFISAPHLFDGDLFVGADSVINKPEYCRGKGKYDIEDLARIPVKFEVSVDPNGRPIAVRVLLMDDPNQSSSTSSFPAQKTRVRTMDPRTQMIISEVLDEVCDRWWGQESQTKLPPQAPPWNEAKSASTSRDAVASASSREAKGSSKGSDGVSKGSGKHSQEGSHGGGHGSTSSHGGGSDAHSGMDEHHEALPNGQEQRRNSGGDRGGSSGASSAWGAYEGGWSNRVSEKAHGGGARGAGGQQKWREAQRQEQREDTEQAAEDSHLEPAKVREINEYILQTEPKEKALSVSAVGGHFQVKKHQLEAYFDLSPMSTSGGSSGKAAYLVHAHAPREPRGDRGDRKHKDRKYNEKRKDRNDNEAHAHGGDDDGTSDTVGLGWQ